MRLDFADNKKCDWVSLTIKNAIGFRLTIKAVCIPPNHLMDLGFAPSHSEEEEEECYKNLHLALETRQHRHFLAILLGHREQTWMPRVLNRGPESFLTLALKYTVPTLIKPLLDARAEPCFVDERGVPALNRCLEAYIFSRNGHDTSLDIIRNLIDAGANVNAVDKHGHTPLLLAVGLIEMDICILLMEKGAKPFLKCTYRLKSSPPGTFETKSPFEYAQSLRREDDSTTTYLLKLRFRNDFIRYVEENCFGPEHHAALWSALHSRLGAEAPLGRVGADVLSEVARECAGGIMGQKQ